LTASQRKFLISALYFLSIGGLLSLVDVTLYSGRGTLKRSIDVLPDWIGMILIVIGLFRLLAVHFSAQFQRLITVALAMALLSLAFDLLTMLIPRMPWRIQGFIYYGAIVLDFLAVVIVATAMKNACRDWGFLTVEKSWRFSRLLWVGIYPPLAICATLGSLWIPAKNSNYMFWMALIVLIAAVPAVHLMISLWRTTQAAKTQR
jgi:hypothetical protein